MVRLLGKAFGRGITQYETDKAEFLIINMGNVGHVVSHTFRRCYDDLPELVIPCEITEIFSTRREAFQYVERHA